MNCFRFMNNTTIINIFNSDNCNIAKIAILTLKEETNSGISYILCC